MEPLNCVSLWKVKRLCSQVVQRTRGFVSLGIITATGSGLTLDMPPMATQGQENIQLTLLQEAKEERYHLISFKNEI
jgi:hypothetical protein